MTQAGAVAKLKRVRKYLAKMYCVAHGTGWGRWRYEGARIAYALLKGKIREVMA